MLFEDEKDYIMRIIKEMVRVLFSLMLDKKYVSVELEKEDKYQVSGTPLRDFLDMVDRGEINEAENMLLDSADYTKKEEIMAIALFYQYLSGKEENFLQEHDYSKEEAVAPCSSFCIVIGKTYFYFLETKSARPSEPRGISTLPCTRGRA